MKVHNGTNNSPIKNTAVSIAFIISLIIHIMCSYISTNYDGVRIYSDEDDDCDTNVGDDENDDGDEVDEDEDDDEDADEDDDKEDDYENKDTVPQMNEDWTLHDTGVNPILQKGRRHLVSDRIVSYRTVYLDINMRQDFETVYSIEKIARFKK
ncbi:hypothetical protein HELRODRAFT_169432 [Helobdella robusta]|uniref:Uncharacterized protein n=1 Tax=Helobdella robusta TaxID=6412 RepID=T1F1X4_HELRO|nr:hypothetical protein HELRODRAFT_169432 [Helobdella robusta]ESO08558.1 hypothetical protein HELRODRAFT_169432 [Helobdella robusta]